MPDHHPGIGGLNLAFGGNVFGWQLDRDRSFAILDAVYEAGIRMIDTAEGYSSWVPGNTGGDSERIIGEWLESRGVRKEMRIATKTGMGAPPFALKPEALAAALEGSLERLRTDYLDIYYAHYDDLTTPLDEVVSGFDALIKAGKVREAGASNYSAERLADVTDTADRLGVTPYTVLQPQYNLVSRQEYEGALQDLCVSRGIAVLPYYGLAAGFLSGKFRKASDWEGTSRAFTLGQFAENGGWETLETMDAIARETGATLPQIALAWLAVQPGIAAPLVSATTQEQLTDLVKGVSLRLTPEHLASLDAAVAA